MTAGDLIGPIKILVCSVGSGLSLINLIIKVLLARW